MSTPKATSFDALLSWCSAQNLAVSTDPATSRIYGRMAGSHGEWFLVARCDADDVLQVYSLHPEGVAEERRTEAARFVARLNRGQLWSAFELDLDEGDLFLRTTLPLDAATPPDGELLGRAVAENVQSFDAAWPAIEAFLGGDSAEAASAVDGSEPQEPLPAGVWAGARPDADWTRDG